MQKYTYGHPFPTGSIQNDVKTEEGQLPFFSVSEITDLFKGDDSNPFAKGAGEVQLVLTFEARPETQVLGLGENVGGINKRNRRFISWNTDTPHHEDGTESLYGAHNFFMILDDERKFGFFIDHPGRIIYDFGFTDSDVFKIIIPDTNANFYVFEHSTPKQIVADFRRAIGMNYIPPKWAFGFIQSRWGYKKPSDFIEIADAYKKAGIPVEGFCADIDYMDNYKDFSVDTETFPDFQGFVEDMKKRHIHMIPIIDAGVKIEPGYETYDTGVKNDYFVKKTDGTNFIGAVWPGFTHFTDFFKPEASAFFGESYKFLTEQGVDGFWNDMNEPAIFYSSATIEEVTGLVLETAEIGPSELRLMDIRHKFNYAQNNPNDYADMKHDVTAVIKAVKNKAQRAALEERFPADENGARWASHALLHNMYGYLMTKSAGEAFEKMYPDKRILLFSRSSFTGMHRYGGIWTGDNNAWWQHLLLNVSMMPGLNMNGFLYSGADLGGFGGNTTRQLMLRWLSFGIFTPLMRNHSAIGTREQELHKLGETTAFRELIRLRYRLIPYIYSEFMKASLKGTCLFRTLSMDYPQDKRAATVYDQLMYGDGIMLAPVYEENTEGRFVYLPSDMMFIKFTSSVSYSTEYLGKGNHYIKVAPGEVGIFLRSGKVLPLCESAMSVEELDEKKFTIIANTRRKEAIYFLYTDDGNTREYENVEHFKEIRACNGKIFMPEGYELIEG